MTSSPGPGLYAVIDTLVASPPRNRSAVEQILGTGLTLSSAGGFNFYEAGNVVLDDATLTSVDYREPGADEHEFGPLLVLTIDGECFAQTDLVVRYGFDAVRSPTGHGAAELRHWIRHQPWGELSFGFSTGDDGCLKEVVFNLRPLGAAILARP